MKDKILWVSVGVAICAVVLGGFLFWRAANATIDARVNNLVASMDVSIQTAREDREEITTRVEKEVVIIHEQVRKEVLALSRDGLADFLVDEILLFRSRSADVEPSPRSPWLDR